jgi:hypothetical protein
MLFKAYLYGYQQKPMPRFIRRLMARTRLHRAWLSGSNGYFVEYGVQYGTCNPYSDSSLLSTETRSSHTAN